MRLGKIKTPKDLVFEPEAHIYTYKGVEVPSVTQILHHCRLTPDWSYTDPWYGERGRMIHLAIQYYEEGVLDWTSLDERIEPFLRGYLLWKHHYRPVQLQVEKQIYNHEWNYAGTEDIYCLVDPFNHRQPGHSPCVVALDRRPTIVDVKAGVAHRSHGYQTAGYAQTINPGAHRMCVYVNEKGGYKVEHYTQFEDFRIFLAATTVYHWRDH